MQHAYNPINWFPWKNEAFEKAKKENKPIFLSIGYSTCHWCHVMNRETFIDSEVAEILNENFIAIKVCREERPDIDSIYMQVCQNLTNHGGWPLSVFLTPEQKPFYAGTYFPKNSSYHHLGFLELINQIKDIWQKNQEIFINQAEKIIIDVFKNKIDTETKPDDLISTTFNFLSKRFDKEYGGFGKAPKFPTPHNFYFLMEYFSVTKQEEALKMTEKSLVQMYRGGIFDHIGYGFSRYSTDQFWLVPHFEKMLYDNALLLTAYTRAFAFTKKPLYKSIAEKIVTFLKRDMKNSLGAFISAIDADSDGEEGKFYVFSEKEILDVLGEEKGKLFNKHYDISEKGNFEGKNIANLLNAKEIDDFFSTEALYEYRKTRIDIHMDKKILTSWNALVISSLAEASIVFEDESYFKLAEDAFLFLEKNLKKDKKIYASYLEENLSEFGFLDDYAFHIYACINLYKKSYDNTYLEKALEILDETLNNFKDIEGGFFLSDKENTSIFIRTKEVFDGAIFSGNSMMAYNLFFLSNYTNNAKYLKALEEHLSFMKNAVALYAGGYSFFAYTLLKLENFSKVTCVFSDDDNPKNYLGLLKNYDIVIIPKDESEGYPLVNNKSTFYICKNNTCLKPQNHL